MCWETINGGVGRTGDLLDCGSESNNVISNPTIYVFPPICSVVLRLEATGMVSPLLST